MSVTRRARGEPGRSCRAPPTVRESRWPAASGQDAARIPYERPRPRAAKTSTSRSACRANRGGPGGNPAVRLPAPSATHALPRGLRGRPRSGRFLDAFLGRGLAGQPEPEERRRRRGARSRDHQVPPPVEEERARREHDRVHEHDAEEPEPQVAGDLALDPWTPVARSIGRHPGPPAGRGGRTSAARPRARGWSGTSWPARRSSYDRWW